MNTDNKIPGRGAMAPTIEIDPRKDEFHRIVDHLSRQTIDLCWHCLTCGGGCPFVKHMDLLPNQVIRLVQLGLGRQALQCKTIWVCVGCHTCSSQCPNSIDIAAVMDALRQLALREGIAPAEKEIFRFHKYIYESIQRHGRLNKLEALVQFKIGTGQMFTDLQLGMRMLTRGKLEILSQRVKQKGELSDIFNYYNERRRSFDPHE